MDEELKFNVDRSSRGNPGLSGICGILRNSEGETLCMSSSFIGNSISSTAEITAIFKTCQLCESVHCPSNVKIFIESDSKSTVSWVNVARAGNVQLLDSILEIKEILQRLHPKVVVCYVQKC
ncbi:hypothetical protein Ddye_030169 [Dipteronia dyeriana]|uniref:RNase H type-1 domain-containing protein n=1 Tax=Dipteronia dyeriana TaxID=168575 RepID=A0AAD9TFZ0_9ROSI|nr:hypothetical protein Ddye_030169 [Dipteronia dyeriana]